MSGASFVQYREYENTPASLGAGQNMAIASNVAVFGMVVALVHYAVPVARVLWTHWRPAAWRARAELKARIPLRDDRVD